MATGNNLTMKQVLEIIANWEPAAGPNEPGGLSIMEVIDMAKAVLSQEKHQIYVVCGSDDYVASVVDTTADELVMKYEFDTEAELRAFNMGLDAADGYLDVYDFETYDEALEHVNEVRGGLEL